ncbi:Hypp5724 [Branchiostoma lanceolatum]|uniref:Hypp5724 protein n=1 Tax=Branchiostoma lanceolatum TaxID=7740 RepID=A0A8J9YSD9_BRALA|nr:Hypp5724 [Branchiostoma lanceolatum]
MLAAICRMTLTLEVRQLKTAAVGDLSLLPRGEIRVKCLSQGHNDGTQLPLYNPRSIPGPIVPRAYEADPRAAVIFVGGELRIRCMEVDSLALVLLPSSAGGEGQFKNHGPETWGLETCWTKEDAPVAVVGGILFSEDFGGSVIFPILPFLTHDFYSYLKSNQLGYHAGFLTSGHYLGNFLGSFMWGKLADKFGLRPTLLTGSLTTMLTFLMFGFSFSFAWAVFILFLGGLLAGNSRIAKTYLYEVSPAKMHAVVFAVVSLANGLAYVVGPTVGGFLSCPATRFSSLDTPVFRRFPYLLPCITSMLVAFVGLLAGFLFLEETKQQGCRGDHVTAMEEINLRQVSG